MAELPDLYQVSIRFDALHFSRAALTLNLLVRGGSGEITGSGEISRSLSPPTPPAHIFQLTGHVQPGQSEDVLHVHVSGDYVESAAPPAIGSFVGPFSASCVVDKQWGGQGTFSYGRYNVGRCVVTKIGE